MTVSVSSLLEVAVPERFKSAADGDDWFPAFGRAEAVGRVIQLRPNKTYELSEAIRNVSNRVWQGSGPSTIVKNLQTHANTAKRGAFMLGNIHPGMFDYASPAANQLPSYDTSAVLAGDIAVQLTTAGDRTNFTVSQFVVVRHVTEVSGAALYPLYAQFTKVTAISVGGLITLEDPVLEPIATACISPIGAVVDSFMGYAFEFVEGVTIRDMTIDARGIASTRTGAYKCAIKDVTVTSGEYLLSINAFVKCAVERVFGLVSDRLLEIKCYSQDNDWRQVTGRIGPGSTAETTVDIGEQSNRNRLTGIRCTIPADNTSAIECLKINGWLNAVHDSEFIHAGTVSGQAVVTIPSNTFTGYGPHNNRITGGRVVSRTDRTHHIIIGSAGGTEDPKNYVIDSVECVGVTSTARSIKVANGGLGGRVINSTLAYIMEISSGATPPNELGNSIGVLVGSSMSAGTASPNSVISAESGSIYQRRSATTDSCPIYIKTGSAANTGWIRIRTMSGVSIRDNVNVAISTVTPEIQDYTTNLTADRYITLPAVSAADTGWTFYVVKSTNAGAGKLGVKAPDATILAEVAAANLGYIWCYWNGTAWAAHSILMST